MMNLNKLINEANTIGISGHYHPDGDCVGATLGLYNYITEYFPDKKVTVFLSDTSDIFSILNGFDKIVEPKGHSGDDYDLFFALDCADSSRLADAYDIYKKAKVQACIDHHLSNDTFASESFIVPDASSTCELVCSLIDPDKISKNTAECFYVGMVHDTGLFQYSSTTSDTMKMAGMLMDKGIDFPSIISYTFHEKTFNQNRLLARAINNARLYENGSIIASVITKEDFKATDTDSKDTEGIVNQLRITKGCGVAIFLYENENRTFKASLRATEEINLSEIAKFFGGGGHAKASGCLMQRGDPWKEVDKIIEKVKEKR